MNFQSSYRKYRPTDFDSVVGQDNIVKTLSNAIEQDKLAHAYLFNGPRGTGKTSIAKIFARKINCTCTDNTCLACTSTSELADIIEMDAASNNGVEEIRRIIENVYFSPMELKYKVYIIDEVHMLSKSAFNALLKTLEEPPKHVKFILATTEIHKIPATIISRCQRFDFKRISIDELTSRLEFVLKEEAIEYDLDGLKEIAKLADGGMRDALSLMDKVIMLSQHVFLKDVIKSLNIVSSTNIKELLLAIKESDVVQTVSLWQEFYSQGIDETKFVIDLQYAMREQLEEELANNKTKAVRKTVEQLKQLNELETRLMYTRNCAMLIEVFLIDLAMEPVKVQPEPVIVKEVVKEPVKPKVDAQEHLEKIRKQKEQLRSSVVEQQQEEVYDDSYLGSEQYVEEINEPPKEVKTVETIANKQEVIEDIIILDVLQRASKKDKNELIANSLSYKRELEVQKKLGLAKFIELAQVVARSPEGIVMTIESQYVESYQNRLASLEEMYSNFLNKPCKIFLLSFQEWEEKRPKYIEELKTYTKENDLFNKAQSFFGKDMVNKI